MSLIVKLLFGFYFGACTGILLSFAATDVFGFSGGPEYGPIVALLCLTASIAVGLYTMHRGALVFEAFGVKGDVATSLKGRLLLVAIILFTIVFAYRAMDDPEAFNTWAFAPPLAVLICYLARWVLRGQQQNA